MGAKLKRYEVEAVVWVRGKIGAKSDLDASDRLLDLISVEEEELERVSGGEYKIRMHAATEAGGGACGPGLAVTSEARADHMSIAEVAARLGKSRSWLDDRLRADAASESPCLQVHSYIGRSRIWDEAAYQALRAAIIAADSSSRRAVSYTLSPALSGSGSAARECAKARSLIDARLGRGSARKPKRTVHSRSRRDKQDAR